MQVADNAAVTVVDAGAARVEPDKFPRPHRRRARSLCRNQKSQMFLPPSARPSKK